MEVVIKFLKVLVKIYKPTNKVYIANKIFQILYYFGWTFWCVIYLLQKTAYFSVQSKSYNFLISLFCAILTAIVVYKTYNIQRLYLITAYGDHINLQYYKGLFYFTEKLVNIDLPIKDIETITYRHYRTTSPVLPEYHVIKFNMNDYTYYEIEVLLDSSLKGICKELNELKAGNNIDHCYAQEEVTFPFRDIAFWYFIIMAFLAIIVKELHRIAKGY
jgi:hypothetical protein